MRHYHWFVALAGAISPHAFAQSPGKCQMPGCGGIWHGVVTRPPVPSLLPVRHPAVIIGTFSGEPVRPPEDPGLSPWWADGGDKDGDGLSNAMENLIERLDARYAEGWRRFILNRPGGDHIDNRYQATPQWWVQPGWKREEILDAEVGLAAWINAHRDFTNPANDISVGFYGGYRLNGDPCWLGDKNGATVRIPKPTLEQDMCEFWLNNAPWYEAGIREFWFDNAGGRDFKGGKPNDAEEKVNALIDITYSPQWAALPEVRFGAEPMFIRVKLGGIPDAATLGWLPWISGHSFLSRQGLEANNPGPWRPEWTFDPGSTEVNVWIKLQDIEEEGFTIDTAYYYVKHGVVLWAWGLPRAEDIVKRIYDFGNVPCPADLNTDGVVDSLDLARLADFFYAGVSELVPYYHGDLNRDGVLDGDDFAILSAAVGPCPQ